MSFSAQNLSRIIKYLIHIYNKMFPYSKLYCSSFSFLKSDKSSLMKQGKFLFMMFVSDDQLSKPAKEIEEINSSVCSFSLTIHF